MKAACFQDSDFIEGQPVTTFYHSGDLGDIIYGLFFASTFRPAVIILGPTKRWELRRTMDKSLFDWFSPLLRRQRWIRDVQFSPNEIHADYNLNDFRHTWFSPRSGCARRRRLFETYPEHFGKPTLPEDESWLEADPIRDAKRPVVINRTTRYQNKDFNWQSISNRYAGKIRFVGTQEEFDAWSKSYGSTAIYHPVKDALELANVIAGAELFIGNQSFPMALALALNVPLIQEVCPHTPDCVFRRGNAQYVQQGFNPKLPPVAQPKRHVSPYPNRSGLYEIGPCADAYGLGDTISILPLARALNPKAVMLMPQEMEHYRFLFNGICPVTVTNDFPVFPWQGLKPVAVSKLEVFGIRNADPLPRITLRPEVIHQAKELLKGYSNPLAFCPTCSRHWSHMRQRPAKFWEPIITELSPRYTVLQFGWEDYPLVPGAVRMPFVSLETLAALYHLVGLYLGVHTGDHHLAFAVGARVVCAEPEPVPEFHAECWRYDSPRIQYGKLNSPTEVMDAIQRMGL